MVSFSAGTNGEQVHVNNNIDKLPLFKNHIHYTCNMEYTCAISYKVNAGLQANAPS